MTTELKMAPMSTHATKSSTMLNKRQNSVLTTEELGSVRTRRGGQIRRHRIDDLLSFRDRKPRKGAVNDELNRHRVNDVLRADQRISRCLLKIKSQKRPLPLASSVRRSQLDCAVILLVDGRVQIDTDPWKGLCH
jgi:hypothetical protein